MLTAGMLGVDFQRPICGFGNPLFFVDFIIWQELVCF